MCNLMHIIRGDMERILAYTVSITELRKAPGELLKQAAGQTVAILSHNKPAGYIMSPEAVAPCWG